MPEKLNDDKIRSLLRELGQQLGERGIVADIYIAGGAAITLCYEQDYSTADVDAVYDPHSAVDEAAKEVAEQVEHDLGEYWLNDAINRYMKKPESDDARTIMADCPGLRVMVASPERILGMKCAAGRSKDVEGIRQLCEQVGVETAEQLVEMTKRHAVLDKRPGRNIERVRSFAKDILSNKTEKTIVQ